MYTHSEANDVAWIAAKLRMNGNIVETYSRAATAIFVCFFHAAHIYLYLNELLHHTNRFGATRVISELNNIFAQKICTNWEREWEKEMMERDRSLSKSPSAIEVLWCACFHRCLSIWCCCCFAEWKRKEKKQKKIVVIKWAYQHLLFSNGPTKRMP